MEVCPVKAISKIPGMHAEVVAHKEALKRLAEHEE
jgi:hypothetical protein